MIIVQCDVCGNGIKLSRAVSIAELRRNDWYISRSTGKFSCPRCVSRVVRVVRKLKGGDVK